MSNTAIEELKRIFTSRLDTLSHILSVAQQNLSDIDAALEERLAPDMFPLGTQIAFACNQPRNFSQWCQGEEILNWSPEVPSMAVAREYIATTRLMVSAITASDAKLAETKRTDLGSGLYCETTGELYVTDYLIPNFYFHVTATYAIFRNLGVPLGKADYMQFLRPHVRQSAC